LATIRAHRERRRKDRIGFRPFLLVTALAEAACLEERLRQLSAGIIGSLRKVCGIGKDSPISEPRMQRSGASGLNTPYSAVLRARLGPSFAGRLTDTSAAAARALPARSRPGVPRHCPWRSPVRRPSDPSGSP